jgi:hypothetical protein
VLRHPHPWTLDLGRTGCGCSTGPWVADLGGTGSIFFFGQARQRVAELCKDGDGAAPPYSLRRQAVLLRPPLRRDPDSSLARPICFFASCGARVAELCKDGGGAAPPYSLRRQAVVQERTRSGATTLFPRLS